MNVEELRMGNLVYDPKLDCPARISLIGPSFVYITITTEVTRGINEIESIEITPEWLEKLGFKRTDTFTWSIIDKVFDTDIEMYRVVYEDGLWAFYFTYGDDWVFLKHLLEVHELQNAFIELASIELKPQKL
jgi:hypothetical protein